MLWLMDNFMDRPVSSVVTCLLIIIYLAGVIGGDWFAERTALVLSDTVGTNFYIWNLFTAGLYEANLFRCLLAVAWVMIGGRKAEGSLGTESFALYVALVNIACGAITSSGLFTLYVITRYETYLFRATYGFGGIAAALAVALKLTHPHEAPFAFAPTLQCQHLPILLVVQSLIAFALGLEVAGIDAPFVVVGTYVGWWYLRFVHQSNECIGDTSEDFAFVTLFPPPIRRYISPFADFCYGVSVLLGFFKDRKPPPPRVIEENIVEAALDPVAERRKAKAREQLDAKLAAMATQDETWDDDEDLTGPNP